MKHYPRNINSNGVLTIFTGQLRVPYSNKLYKLHKAGGQKHDGAKWLLPRASQYWKGEKVLGHGLQFEQFRSKKREREGGRERAGGKGAPADAKHLVHRFRPHGSTIHIVAPVRGAAYCVARLPSATAGGSALVAVPRITRFVPGTAATSSLAAAPLAALPPRAIIIFLGRSL